MEVNELANEFMKLKAEFPDPKDKSRVLISVQSSDGSSVEYAFTMATTDFRNFCLQGVRGTAIPALPGVSKLKYRG